MRARGTWRCGACGSPEVVVAHERARLHLSPLSPGAIACSQGCALALVREALGRVDALLVERGLAARARAGAAALPRDRAAYLRVAAFSAMPASAPGP